MYSIAKIGLFFNPYTSQAIYDILICMESQQQEHEDTQTIETVDTAPKKVILTLPLAVLTGMVIIAIAILFSTSVGQKAEKTEAPAGEQPKMPTSVPSDVVIIRADDHVRGNAATAEVLVFEYSDSDCPFCAKFHPTLTSIVSDSKGTVAWVYRPFPLIGLHPNAYTEAVALECVATLGGNTAFWNYLDAVVDITVDADATGAATLATLANKEGLTTAQFNACVADKKSTAKVDADSAEAQKFGARGTPFSVAVNVKTGKQVIIPGAYPLADVTAMIDSIR